MGNQSSREPLSKRAESQLHPGAAREPGELGSPRGDKAVGLLGRAAAEEWGGRGVQSLVGQLAPGPGEPRPRVTRTLTESFLNPGFKAPPKPGVCVSPHLVLRTTR